MGAMRFDRMELQYAPSSYRDEEESRWLIGFRLLIGSVLPHFGAKAFNKEPGEPAHGRAVHPGGKDASWVPSLRGSICAFIPSEIEEVGI